MSLVLALLRVIIVKHLLLQLLLLHFLFFLILIGKQIVIKVSKVGFLVVVDGVELLFQLVFKNLLETALLVQLLNQLVVLSQINRVVVILVHLAVMTHVIEHIKGSHFFLSSVIGEVDQAQSLHLLMRVHLVPEVDVVVSSVVQVGVIRLDDVVLDLLIRELNLNLLTSL